MELFSVLRDNYNLFSVFVGFVVILLIIKWLRRVRSPPGPTIIPYVGIVPGLVGDLTGPVLKQWADDANANIISVRLLGQKLVVISSYDLIKEIFSKRPEFSDRLNTKTVVQVVDPQHEGLVFTSGPVWRRSRQITLRWMREFGMGRQGAEHVITQEASFLIEKYRSYKGKAFEPGKWLISATSNVMNSFSFGKRFDYDDPKFVHILDCIDKANRACSHVTTIIAMPFKLGRMIMRKKVQNLHYWWHETLHFVDEQIEEHKRDFDGTVRDLIDAFMDEGKKENSVFEIEQIRSTVIDLFIAGADTSKIQIYWLILYMAKFPVIQEKVYRELKRNIGDETPTMQCKKMTPYTEATINEVMRINILMDFGLFRTNLKEDFEIEGYQIAKGTPLFANYWAVHFDPETFPKPFQFDPGHFLNDEGQVVNQERMMSFTVGRRSCAGESLARMEIYLFFVMIMLEFKIEAPDGVDLDLKKVSSGLTQPKDYKIRMIPRAR